MAKPERSKAKLAQGGTKPTAGAKWSNQARNIDPRKIMPTAKLKDEKTSYAKPPPAAQATPNGRTADYGANPLFLPPISPPLRSTSFRCAGLSPVE